jgi:tetratricopeptide (TPR) repeat protein/serine phosphatase RsbU (regulator of sigma subunit)
MKSNTYITAFFVSFLIITSGSFAQDSPQLEVEGVVLHNAKPLNGAVINVILGSSIESQVVSKRNGRFDFYLDYGKDYVIETSREGYITKKIIISTKIDEDIIKAGGITEGFFDLQIEMIEMVPGINMAVFNRPVRKYVFERNSWLFYPDKDFEAGIIERINEITDQLSALKRKEYNRQIKTADNLIKNANYEDAWMAYDNALQYLPDEQYPKSQIKKIDKIVKAQKATEENYKNSVGEGDYYYTNENFKQASAYYKKALLYKPEDGYSLTMIDAIDSIYTQIYLEKKNAYDRLVSSADEYLKVNDYKNAIVNLNKALEILPDEQLPKTKIEEISGLLAQAEEEKKINKVQEATTVEEVTQDSQEKRTGTEQEKNISPEPEKEKKVRPEAGQEEEKKKEKLAEQGKEKEVIAAGEENVATTDLPDAEGTSEEQINKHLNTLRDKEEAGDLKAVAIISGEIGSLYHDDNQLGKALEYYNKSLTLKKETGDLEGASLVLNDIAVTYYDSGRYETAVENYEESYKISEELGNKKVSAVILDNIGQVYENTYQYEKAVKFYEQSLEISKGLDEKEDEALMYDKIANIYVEQNDLGKAIDNCQKSLEIDKKLNKEENVAATLNNMGSIYYNMGNYDNAREYYEQSLDVTRKIGDQKQISIALNNIGNINYNWNKYRKAIDFYKQSIEIKQGIDYKRGVAASLHNIGNAYKGLKDYNQAIEYYRQSNELAGEINYPEVVARNNRAFSEVYSLLNDYKKAYEYQKLFADLKHTIQDDKSQIFEGISKEKEEDQRVLIAALRRQIQKQKLLAEYESIRRQKELEIKNLELENEKEKTKRQQFIIMAGLAGLIILIIFIVLIYRQYIQKKKANIELIAKNRIISHQKQQITDSIRYASRIQKAVLPPEEYITGIVPQHFILNIPRDIVSGDYYWTTQRANESIIAVADCTGHGVPGAFMSMLGIAFLNEIVNKSVSAKSHEILGQLRNNIMSSLHQTGREDEAKDGMDIALIVINLKSKLLQFSGAHNPLYLIRDKKLREVKADKMPIGISARYDKPFSNHKIQLQKDDMLYIFSDGYLDQFGGEHRKKFGYRRFRDLLLEIHLKELNEQKDILEKTFAGWKGKYDQIDDILVMGIRV